MPKVSEQYLADRRAQILGAARRCFLRDGFHATSMQDLFAESGLSAGAVYRYFASKDEMILAIAEENMHEVAQLALAAGERDHDSFGDSLASVIDIVRAKHEEQGVGSLALQVWSEAARNPALRARFVGALEANRAALVDIIGRHQRRGHLPPDIDTAALANTFASLIPGYLVQLSLVGPDAVYGVADAIRALWPTVPERTVSPPPAGRSRRAAPGRTVQ